MKGKGNKSEEKSMTALRESKQMAIQSEEGIFTNQCEGEVISTAVPASIVLNSNLGSMNLGAQKDLGNQSLLDLLKTVTSKSRSLASMVQESIDEPDDDEEKESKKEAKALKKLLEKIARRIVPSWNIEVLRGEHPGKSTKMLGVKITSKVYDDETRTYTLDYLEEKDQAVINDLRNIGPFRPSDYGFLIEYVRLLIDEQKVTQVDSLSEQLNNCLPEVKARELFDFMVTKVIENLSFFPKLSLGQSLLNTSGNFDPEDYDGVQLDTKEYGDRFDLDMGTGNVVAFGVTTKFLTKIFELSSHKVAFFLELTRSWREYGFVSQPATYNGRHVERVHIFGGKGHDFYLFRVDDFNKRKEAVKASLRDTNHAE